MEELLQPIVIGDRCVIQYTFHNDVHKQNRHRHQSANGIRHRGTTRQQALIIGELLDSDLQASIASIWVVGLPILPYWHACGASPCTAMT